MKTHLDYLGDTYKLTSEARIIGKGEDEKGAYLAVDRTIFYPQGGGQPTDIGSITKSDGTFLVAFVSLVDNVVYHYGEAISGGFQKDDPVELFIEETTRMYNARNHTAGHLVAFAGQELFPSLVAVKGYHFPDGAYVEFSGRIKEVNMNEVITSFEVNVNGMVRSNAEVVIQDTSVRTMTVAGDYTLPCGGTHVKRLGEVGEITIKKIKQRGEHIRVSYRIEEA